MSTALPGDPVRNALGDLTLSFGGAAWVVLAGVLAGWLYLQQAGSKDAAQLPEIPSFAVKNTAQNAEVDWSARAEQAFAAGRITRPQGDSALDFYLKIRAADSDHAGARRGLQRIQTYLVNAAETALQQSDWATATDLANQTLVIEPDNRSAASVVARAARGEQIKQLGGQAIEQIAAGRLTLPQDDNALASYRQILELDPTNAAAAQGIESIAQRLATIAQTEALAQNHERARALIQQARQIAPHATGIAESEQLTRQWTNMISEQSVKDDLIAGSGLLEKGVLTGMDSKEGVGALEYYQAALTKDAKSSSARAGLEAVIGQLIERGWQAAQMEQLEELAARIDQAAGAGAAAEQLGSLRDELAFLRKRARARGGEFDDVVSVGELTARRQSPPEVPRGVTEGWVELLFTVSETGEVDDIEVVEASSPELDESAVNAVRRWRFEPYLEQGRPIPVRSGIRFTFQS